MFSHLPGDVFEFRGQLYPKELTALLFNSLFRRAVTLMRDVLGVKFSEDYRTLLAGGRGDSLHLPSLLHAQQPLAYAAQGAALDRALAALHDPVLGDLDEVRLNDTMGQCAELVGLLAALTWMGGGVPSRVTETSTILYNRRPHVGRQLFMSPSSSGLMLNTRIAYNKVRRRPVPIPGVRLMLPPQVNNAQHSSKVIHRYLPAVLSRLLAEYLLQVRPPSSSKTFLVF